MSFSWCKCACPFCNLKWAIWSFLFWDSATVQWHKVEHLFANKYNFNPLCTKLLQFLWLLLFQILVTIYLHNSGTKCRRINLHLLYFFFNLVLLRYELSCLLCYKCYTIQEYLIGQEGKATGLFFKNFDIWKLEALIFTSKKK